MQRTCDCPKRCGSGVDSFGSFGTFRGLELGALRPLPTGSPPPAASETALSSVRRLGGPERPRGFSSRFLASWRPWHGQTNATRPVEEGPPWAPHPNRVGTGSARRPARLRTPNNG